MRWFGELSLVEWLLLGFLTLSVVWLGWMSMPGEKWPVDPVEKQALDKAPDICVIDKSGKEHCEGPTGKQTTTVIDGYQLNRQPAP